MTPTCPDGHPSESTDFCSVCGKRMAATAATGATTGGGEERAPQASARPTTGQPMVTAAGQARICPNCQSTTTGELCAECGYAFDAADSIAVWEEEHWEVVARPDRQYFEMINPDGLEFPDRPYTRRIALVGDYVRIGRRSKGAKPEIDLTGALEDSGVSRRHAVLMRQPDGSWALVDQGSSNGTYLNSQRDPIVANERVPLRPSDQIHVGAWTTLTIERADVVVSPSREVSVPSKDTRNLRSRQQMEIRLLGPLQVSVGGAPVAVTAPHARVVLARLALRIGSTVSVDELEWSLWGDDVPPSASAALRGLIGDVRKLLGKEAIEYRAPGYRLVGSKDMVDVCRFDQQTDRGREQLLSGHPGFAVVELERALELWRGDPLTDLADGPDGAAEVGRLYERRARAEEDLFEGRLQLGDHEGVVADLSAAVKREPLRERRLSQLMVALYRCGRTRDADQAFQQYRATMVEYGLEPSSQIQTLNDDIVIGRPELQWTPPSEPGGPPITPT